MSTTIYYFSTTGNTLCIARDIARELGDADIKSIRGLARVPVAVDEGAIGIVFPIYCWGVPRIVAEFVKRLELPRDIYVFAVCTFGGTLGGALVQMRNLVAGRGAALGAGWAVQMPNNYPPVGGGWAEAKQTAVFEKARLKVKAIAKAVKTRAVTRVEQWPTPLCWATDVAYRAAMAHFPQADKRFTLSDACTHCGICARVCPVNNIDMVNGKPTWKHNCEQCMACLQWCPVEAINWTRISVGRKRYRHPSVKVKEMWEG